MKELHINERINLDDISEPVSIYRGRLDFVDWEGPTDDFNCRLDNQKIKHNMAQCLRCGDILESIDADPQVRCSCGRLTVDGGTKYIYRHFGRGMYAKDWKELSEYEDCYNYEGSDR